MKLFSELTAIYSKSLTTKDVLTVLRNLGLEDTFDCVKRHKDFTKFIYYFINAYSVESTMMDSENYKKSLKLIEKNFDFEFDSFKTSFTELFPEQYNNLINEYLELQRNRDYRSLVQGNILYDQMSTACISRSILKGGKDSTDVDIDYKAKFDIFMNSLELSKELKVLEASLKKHTDLENAVQENTEKATISIRVEDHLPDKK